MLKYRLFWADGGEAAEAAYAVNIQSGEAILVGNGRKLRMLDVVPVEEDGSPYVGLLTVEAAYCPAMKGRGPLAGQAPPTLAGRSPHARDRCRSKTRT